MGEIITISGVDCYEKNGVAYLNLEQVARGLGFVQEKNGVEYVRWDRVDEYLVSFGFPHKRGKNDFIPENVFYRLAMKAKNEASEKFQAKIADEVIPSIRKTGRYVAPGQTDLNDTSHVADWVVDLIQTVTSMSKSVVDNQTASESSREIVLKNIELAKEVYLTQFYCNEPKLALENNEAMVPSVSPQSDFDECLVFQEDASPFEQYVLTDNRQHWKVSDLAKLYGTTADKFNKKLASLGVQHKYKNAWRLEPEYENKGYDTYLNTSSISGVSGMYWTKEGVLFLYRFLKGNALLPLCEKEAA